MNSTSCSKLRRAPRVVNFEARSVGLFATLALAGMVMPAQSDALPGLQKGDAVFQAKVLAALLNTAQAAI